MQQPLVSVIIPFLNEEFFLEEAIESVLSQTYERWELLLVDDGSTDKSSVIAKSHAGRNPAQITYLEHEKHANRGLSFSRNFGINQATGEIIGFLDADDVWLPQKLQLQVGLMTAMPEVAMLCEASEYWYYNWPDKSKTNIIKHVGIHRDRKFIPPDLLTMLYPLSANQAPAPSGIMVRRNIAIKHGGFDVNFTGKYQLYEDQAFLHKLYINEPVYISSLCNHRYRQRKNSIVSKTTSDGDYHLVRKFFLEWLEQYLKQHNIKQIIIQRLLNKAFEPYRKPYLHFAKKLFRRIITAIQKRIG